MRDLGSVSHWIVVRLQQISPIITGGGRADAENRTVEVELAHVGRRAPFYWWELRRSLLRLERSGVVVTLEVVHRGQTRPTVRSRQRMQGFV
jgi:hypothetical protein